MIIHHVKMLNVWATVIISLFSLLVALHAVRSQIAAGIQDQRAWIGAPKITPWVDVGTRTQNFTLAFTNVGRTPALGSFVGAGLITKPGVEDMTPDDWEMALNLHCRRGEKENEADIRRFAIFPGGQLELTGDTPGREVHLSRPIAEYLAISSEHPHIIGCITYVTADGTRHRTGFAAPLVIDQHGVAVAPVLAVRPS